jgi:hypothetical protein
MSITPEGMAGIESSAAHAEQDAPGWGVRAYASVRRYPIIFGATDEFTMEAARQWAYAMGLDRPADERAWGAVTQKLVRDEIIEPVGYAPAASSHGSPKRTYRLVVAP